MNNSRNNKHFSNCGLSKNKRILATLLPTDMLKRKCNNCLYRS